MSSKRARISFPSRTNSFPCIVSYKSLKKSLTDHNISFFQAKKSVTSTKKDLSSKAGKPNKTKTSSKSNGGSNNTKPKSEAAKARDEARRKMLEEKKRQMKLKQQQKTEEANEVIFVEF